RVRKRVAPDAGVFHVYSVLIGSGHGDGPSADAGAEEMRVNYNVGGICLSEAAFAKLQQEISLSLWTENPTEPAFLGPWVDQHCQFFVGTVPITNGVFRSLAIRKNRIPQVDVRDLSILRWTDSCYYEVCANPAVYAALAGAKSASGRS